MSRQLSAIKVNKLNQLVRSNGLRSNFIYDNASSFTGRPISNFINTCYIGSVLQCLNPFEKILKSIIEHKYQLETIYMEKDYELFSCYVEFLYNGLNMSKKPKQSSFKHLQLKFFASLFDSDLKNNFAEFEQNDAHEFLIQFIEYIDNCIIEIEIGKRGLRPNDNINIIYDNYKQTHSVVSNSFMFKTLQKMTCSRNIFHQKQIETTQFCLQVPIDKNCKTIEDCVDLCFQNELIDNTNCSMCNTKLEFNCESKIQTTNENLIIMIKRFKMEQNGNLIKIDNYIEFQETLDLTRFLWTSNDTNSRRTEYQLVSVCFHLGDSSNSGHITSLVYCEKKKMWHYFDDENVEIYKNVDDFIRSRRQSSQSYILFYKLKSTQIQNIASIQDLRRSETMDELTLMDTDQQMKKTITIDSQMSIEINFEQNSQIFDKNVQNSNDNVNNGIKRITKKDSLKKRNEYKKEWMKNKRKDLLAKQMEQINNTLRKKEKRQNDESFRANEQSRNTTEHSLRRQDPNYRANEQSRNTNEHLLRRQDPNYRANEQSRNTNEHLLRRQDPNYRANEQSRNTNEHLLRRQDPNYRANEQSRNTNEHVLRRQDPEYRANEQSKNTFEHSLRRQDPDYRANEQLRNTIEHSLRRQDPIYRADEQLVNTLEHRIRRDDIEYRSNEQIRNTLEHNKRRLDTDYRQKEKQKDKSNRADKRTQHNNLIDTYESGIKNGPSFVCVCCGGLFFKRTVEKFLLNQNNSLYTCIFNVDIKSECGFNWICVTCNKYVKENKIPTLCLSNGLNFPIISDELKCLNDLEERLCSPRLPFIRIKELVNWDHQQKIVGNIVNVPIDTEKTLEFLPREFNESETIQLVLKRRMDYKKAYRLDKIRPLVILKAIRYLINKPLFKENQIKLSTNWFENHKHIECIDLTEDFIVNDEDRDLPHINSILNNQFEMINQNVDYLNENNYMDELRETEQTLLVDTSEMIKTIAPGEGIQPRSILSDKDAEELTFLKIYGGEKYSQKVQLKYGMRCKSEFRRYDRRCAQDINKIFYSYKKLVSKKLNAAIDTCLRKTKEIDSMTARDALNKQKINDLIVRNEAQMFMRTIRSSPQYWEWKKMEINAMIRQLGCPSFFITFSPAEIDWNELISILIKTLENKYMSNEELNQIGREKRIELVSRDPITVARYFENRMGELLKYVFNQNGPFRENPVFDYFWRVEFQNRGSPHIHLITWNKNAPQYDETNLEDNEQNINNEMIANCCEFIDKYITTNRKSNNLVIEDDYENRTQLLQEIPIKYQIHVHKDNCKYCDEYGNIMCKYGFPWPILDKTIILEPMKKNNSDYSKSYENYLMIRDKLNEINTLFKRNNNYTISFVEFLNSINLSEYLYIKALRTCIKRTTVFLKRTSNDIMVNPYNKQMYVRHRANMDIQFITDPYGAAAYVSAYMLKSNATMSRLLKNTVEEVIRGNLSVKQRLLKVANKFNNCCEISAQECAYTLLSMPVSRTSRETIYVNTFPSKERNVILKDDRYLELLNPESRNIFRAGILQHYVNRPNSMSNMCLAEFATQYDYVSNERAKNPNDLTRIDRFYQDNDENLDEDDNNQHFANESLATIDLNQQIDENNLDLVIDNNATLIRLINKNGYVKRRNKCKILRYKRYNRIKDPYNYYRVELMLFFPWRNEKSDVEVRDPFEKFEQNKISIATNHARFESVIAEEFDRAQNEIETAIQEHYERLVEDYVERVNEANENLITNANEAQNEEYEDEFGYHAILQDELSTIQSMLNTNTDMITLPKRISNDEYTTLMKSLNRIQHKYLVNFIDCVRSNRPFYHFVSGGAGTGKSHLIKSLYQTFIRLNVANANHRQDSNSSITALLTAFTGKAAFNIKGSTLHSLFHLPIHTSNMDKLSDKLLTRVRRSIGNVKLIIIDEISMVGAKLFSKLNKRLQQIMDNNKPFGNVAIVVVGDLNQICPVHDSWIFEIAKHDNAYSILTGEMLWQMFEFIELKEIMRQRDDAIFAQALNTLGNKGVIGLSDDQVRMFNSRIVNIEDIPQDAICVIHSNKGVEAYNEYKLKAMPGNLVENRAIDLPMGKDKQTNKAKNLVASLKHEKDTNKTCGMPTLLRFKLNCKYMITTNLRTEDGLVNGAVAQLKHIVFTKNKTDDKPLVKRVYLEFQDKDVGQLTRQGSEQLKWMKSDGLNASNQNNSLTVLEYEQQTVKRPKCGGNYHVDRRQFTLVECEAMTIHKSQGQSYTRVAVNIGEPLKRSLLYVAMSRATKLNGLYLYGSKSIESARVQRLSKEKRQQELEMFEQNDPVRVEMNRLRCEALIKNNYSFLDYGYEEKKACDLTILYHNIQSFNANRENLKSDYGYKQADIVLLSECHNTKNNRLLANSLFNNYDDDQNNYELAFYSYGTELNASNGQICFIRKEFNSNLKLIAHNATTDNQQQQQQAAYYIGSSQNKCVELSLFEYTNSKNGKKVYLLNLYKHPKMDNQKFLNDLFIFLRENCNQSIFESLIVLGDFNIDFNQETNKKYLQLFKTKLNIEPFFFNSNTYNNVSQIDWCFYNKQNKFNSIKSQPYSTWFSDHCAIFTQINF